MGLWAAKMGAGFMESPWTRVTLGLEASFWAEGEEVLRVRARISKGAEEAMRASITAPPCLPVAPVMRTLRSAMVVV